MIAVKKSRRRKAANEQKNRHQHEITKYKKTHNTRSNAINRKTEKEENMLLSKSEDYKKLIEERLLFAYGKIRSNVKNGLAIVPIERGAAGGSYFTIPPQVQMEIASRKKIITDEHSGRILVDEVLASEQKEKMEKLKNQLKFYLLILFL